MFIYAKVFRASMQGQIERHCTCERCGTAFSYCFFHEGNGRGTSAYGINNQGAKTTAQQTAVEDYKKTLADKHPHFPCPSCGWYQTYMNAYYRRTRFRKPYGFLLLAASALFLILVLYAYTLVRDDGFRAASGELLSSAWTWILFLMAGVLAALTVIRKRSDLNLSAPPLATWPSATQAAQEMHFDVSFDAGATRKGPFTREQVQSMYEGGRLRPETLVSPAEESAWQPIAEFAQGA